MVLNAHRNHEAYYGQGEGGEGGMEVGGEGGRAGEGRLYTYRYTVTTRMNSALRWAAIAVRAILTFHNCEEQSDNTVSTDHNF